MQRARAVWWRGVWPHGLVCGLLMTALALLLRGWDAPVPLLAAAFCSPYSAVPGHLVGRHHGSGMAVMTGAVTAATGHVIVFLVAVGYAAATQPWPKPWYWGLMGLLSVAVTFMLGMFFGRVGAALVRRQQFTLPTPPRRPVL